MKDGDHDGAQVHMVVYERQDIGLIKYEPVMQREQDDVVADIEVVSEPELEQEVVVESEQEEAVDAVPEVVVDPEQQGVVDVVPDVVVDPEQHTSYELVDLINMNPEEMTLEQKKQLQYKTQKLRDRIEAEKEADIAPTPLPVVETKLDSEGDDEDDLELEISGNSDDVGIMGENDGEMGEVSSSEDTVYDMVEVIIEYKTRPKKTTPLIKGTKWFKDESGDDKVYYMANKDTNEPYNSIYVI